MSDVLSDLAGGGQPGPTPSTAPTGSDAAPDTREIELEVLRRYGHDVSKYETTPTAAPGGTVNGPVAQTGEEASDVLRLAPEDARAMAAALIRGGMDPAKAEVALKAELGEVPAEAPDERTDEQKAHDANFNMDREFAPGDYDQLALAYRDAGLIQNLTPEGMSEWQEFLSAGQVLPGMGEGLVSEMLKAGQRYSRMSAAERTLWNAEQAAEFRISAGSTDAAVAERMRTRDLLLVHLAEQGQVRMVAMLRDSGALNSAFVTSTFSNLGQRLEGWKKGL